MLATATVRALSWNYAGAATRVLAQLAIGAVLARLLGPEPFGLVAVSWLLISLGNLIADFGFGAALVQKKSITEDDIRSTFTVQVLMGLGLTLGTALLANPIAQLFSEPDLVPVVRLLSCIYLLQSLGQTAYSLLKRNLDFRTIQVSQVTSYVVAFLLVGIPMAYRGGGVWSLVTAQLVQTLLFTLLLYRSARHSIVMRFRTRDTGLSWFGFKVMATNLVNWVISNIESLFIGRAFGVLELGLYNRVFTLLFSPVTSIVSVLQGVLFPFYAKMQDDQALLARSYLASIGVISLVLVPLFVGMAVAPTTVISGVYGNAWLDTAPVLVPIALAMPFHAVMALAGPVMWGKGTVERELRVQALVALAALGVLWATSSFTLVHVAWGVFGVYVMRFVLMTSAVTKLLQIPRKRLWVVTRGSLVLAGSAAAAIRGADALLMAVGLDAVPRLGAIVLVAAITVLGVLFAFPAVVLSQEAVWVLDRVSCSLPAASRKWVAKLVSVKGL